MMYRRVRQQWLLIPILIMLTFSGSFLMMKNPQHPETAVYYVRSTVRTLTSQIPTRHVTKSLAELGQMDETNKFVLFLNQIPNCGAEVLIFLLQKLQGANSFRHVRLKGGPKGRLNKHEQEEFIEEVYKVIRDVAVPLAFDRQMPFVNFPNHGRQSPTFINFIREPTDKIVSRSFYRRKKYDDLEPCLSLKNCTGVEVNPRHLTVPFFCGHRSECFENREWALKQAQRNVEKFYPVVGILEEMNATLEVLEHELPYFFKGVQSIYRNKMIERFNKKKTLEPDPEIRKHLEQILSEEYEFYNWIKRRLFNQLQILYGDHSSH